MNALAALRVRLRRVWPVLDERTRRMTAANEAMAWGSGGISAVSRACGLSRRVVRRGIEELTEGRALPAGRIRRPGGGRKRITVTDPAMVRTLEAAVADDTRGDPQSPLRWTCKSTSAGAGDDPPPPPGQSCEGRPVAARPGVQSAEQSENRGRARPRGPRRTVSAYQHR